MIERTAYARPALPDGTGVELLGSNFPDQVLDPGGATQLEFPMLATGAMSGILGPERIAKARVKASLDMNEYCVISRSSTIQEQIFPVSWPS